MPTTALNLARRFSGTVYGRRGTTVIKIRGLGLAAKYVHRNYSDYLLEPRTLSLNLVTLCFELSETYGYIEVKRLICRCKHIFVRKATLISEMEYIFITKAILAKPFNFLIIIITLRAFFSQFGCIYIVFFVDHNYQASHANTTIMKL